MPHYCFFDRLPVELLQTLFGYFLAHEILLAFSDISDYVNSVLRSYSDYQLDLKSIRKIHFDLICRHIRPEQVISLILSDADDIEQFTQLRSLTLIQIKIDSLKMIFSNLHKLSQLRSISFDIEMIRHKYPAWNNDYSNESNRLKPLLLDTYTIVLPQLSRICQSNSSDLVSILFPNLRHLKLTKFSSVELETISQNSRQLKSLHLCLYMNRTNSEFILPVNQLIRLNLKIESTKNNYSPTKI
jgi:hypothetical protein